MPAVGFSGATAGEDSLEDVTPPSYLMEHPPLAVFINGVSAAMNELRPCAPLGLKHILAQELAKGLKAVHDSLLRYNETRMLRENESALFFSLCRAFIEVAFPHCATCFGRCYPGGTALIMEAKSSFGGISRLLSVSSAREIPRRTQSANLQIKSENGSSATLENGVHDSKEVQEDQHANAAEDGQRHEGEDLKTEEKDGNS